MCRLHQIQQTSKMAVNTLIKKLNIKRLKTTIISLVTYNVGGDFSRKDNHFNYLSEKHLCR